MKLSPLQKARYEYQPKLPGMLRNGISSICVKEGEATQSVADQDKIAALFPNTYGKKEITFVKGANTSAAKKQVVGVILSGGQAPGGHNVVSGLYDALKATNKDNVLIGFKGGPSGLTDDIISNVKQGIINYLKLNNIENSEKVLFRSYNGIVADTCGAIKNDGDVNLMVGWKSNVDTNGNLNYLEAYPGNGSEDPGIKMGTVEGRWIHRLTDDDLAILVFNYLKTNEGKALFS